MVRTARPIDYEIVRKLASIGCTDREVAAVLEFTPEWICKRQQKDEQLREALERGRDQGKVSLRRMQWKKATEGNPTMMIWLGKQILGQRDRFEHGGDPERPLHPANRILTDEELMAIAAQALPKKGDGDK